MWRIPSADTYIQYLRPCRFCGGGVVFERINLDLPDSYN